MSQEPRPTQRSPSSASAKGSCRHPSSSAGTTSMCPERTSPLRLRPSGSGPSQAITLVLVPSAEGFRAIRTPGRSR